MTKIKIYDLPIRIFHWLFAGLFVTSFFIAEVIDDDSLLYTYHMLAGFLMVFLIVLRVLWGIIGTKYARLSAYKLSPSDLIKYLSSILNSKSKKYIGHNPASSYAALAMFVFTFGLVLSGVFMTAGFGEDVFEDVHELLATGFIITIIMHILGVVIHQLKHKDGMILSMFNGSRVSHEVNAGIKGNQYVAAIVFIGAIIAFSFYLNKNYDVNSRQLNIFGTKLDLGDDDHKDRESGTTYHLQRRTQTVSL